MKINKEIIKIATVSSLFIICFIFRNKLLYIVSELNKCMHNKKFAVLGIVTSLIVVTIFFSGCTDGGSGTLMLEEETEIPEEKCKSQNLKDEILMIESESCSHCAKAEPKLKELEEEMNVSISFIDASTQEGSKKLEDHKISIKYTPTVIIDCEVLIENKDKEEYREEIQSWKNEE